MSRISTPRNQVTCPICSLRLPSSHIELHAATCGEERKSPLPVDEKKEEPSSSSSRQKRKRDDSLSSSPTISSRKSTARDRRHRQRLQRMEEEDEEISSLTLPSSPSPLALSDSPRPPSASSVNSVLRDAHRQRKERVVITTFPPSSPVLHTSPTEADSSFRLTINIPSPSPPPSLSSASFPSFPSPPPSSYSPFLQTFTRGRSSRSPLQSFNPSPTSPLSSLTLLTYNVWFDELAMDERMQALSSLISSLLPTVLALQEVTQQALSVLSASSWWSLYYVSPPPSTPYFTLLLTRHPPSSSYRIPFISQMGRDLTIACLDLPTPVGVRRLVISTSHLESLWQSRERRAQQLKQSLNILTEFGSLSPSPSSPPPPPTSLILMGDCNLKANEGSNIITDASFSDLYLQYASTHPSHDKTGYTMDGTINRMIKGAEGKGAYRARLDRVLGRMKGLDVDCIRRVGMEKIGDGLWISDHFGLLTELRVV